jgi:hypothetical protein
VGLGVPEADWEGDPVPVPDWLGVIVSEGVVLGDCVDVTDWLPVGETLAD